MITQKLYVDFAGSQFITWFYSEGIRYRGIASAFYNDILQYKRKKDFTDIIITGEARLFIKKQLNVYFTSLLLII